MTSWKWYILFGIHDMFVLVWTRTKREKHVCPTLYVHKRFRPKLVFIHVFFQLLWTNFTQLLCNSNEQPRSHANYCDKDWPISPTFQAISSIDPYYFNFQTLTALRIDHAVHKCYWNYSSYMPLSRTCLTTVTLSYT